MHSTRREKSEIDRPTSGSHPSGSSEFGGSERRSRKQSSDSELFSNSFTAQDFLLEKLNCDGHHPNPGSMTRPDVVPDFKHISDFPSALIFLDTKRLAESWCWSH